MPFEDLLKRIDTHLFAMVGLEFISLKMKMASNPAMYTKDDKRELRALHADYVEMLGEREPDREEGS